MRKFWRKSLSVLLLICAVLIYSIFLSNSTIFCNSISFGSGIIFDKGTIFGRNTFGKETSSDNGFIFSSSSTLNHVSTVSAKTKKTENDATEDTAPKEYRYKNEETSYEVVLYDEADLLTENERYTLMEEMEALTIYGNVCFLTMNKNYTSAERAAEKAHRNYFGTESSTLFLIDMDNRKICLWNDGEIEKTITKDYSTTITDNVYKYASDMNYYKCASEAFSQVKTLLEGRKIAQPMKYISNTLLAVILAAILDFAFVIFLTKRWRKSTYGTEKGSAGTVEISNFILTKTRTDKVYSPVEHSSGGGHSGGGHSGGGGGHSSGSGGSHSF